jgi:hypothetical protein
MSWYEVTIRDQETNFLSLAWTLSVDILFSMQGTVYEKEVGSVIYSF